MKSLSLFVALTAAGILSPYQAIAQNAQESAAEDASRTTGIIQNVPETSGENTQTCQPVNYADLLGSPDNIDLNYCYARQKIDTGQYKDAVPALERLLLLAPNRHDIRMLYASLLYRLDMMNESTAEINKLQQLPLSDNDRKMLATYIEKIEKRQSSFRQSLTLSAGVHYDTNRNAAPASDSVLISGGTLPILDENSREDDDFGFLGAASYGLEYDFGAMKHHSALASLTYFQDDQVTRDELDLGSFSAKAGARFDMGKFDLTALASYTNLDLSREKFYQNTGATLRLDKTFHRGANHAPIKGWISSTYGYEKYGNISENSSLRTRTGHRSDTQIGSKIWITPKHRLSGGLDFTHKDARVNYQSYNFWNANIGHIWRFDNGSYLSSSASYGQRDYKGSDPFVTGNNNRDREEEPIRLNTTYTMPVAYLFDEAGVEFSGKKTSQSAFFQNFNISFGAEYLNQDSNITNYDYDNVRGQILLTKRFDF